MNADLETLDWDSGFFSLLVARIVPNRLNDAEWLAILQAADSAEIDCLYFLAEDERETVATVERAGFGLMDVRVEYDLRLGDRSREWPDDVRLGELADREELLEVAGASYTQSRFFRDPRFADDRCAELYRTWLHKSFEGLADAVVVVEDDEGPAGFVTCSVRGAVGAIGLVGVHSRARGRGLGGRAVRGALAWFADRGVTTVEVVTQGRNIGAQRLYQSCGFRLARTRLWYHRWFDR